MSHDPIAIDEQMLSMFLKVALFFCVFSSVLILCIGLFALYLQGQRIAKRISSLQRQCRRMQKDIDQTAALVRRSYVLINEIIDQLDDAFYALDARIMSRTQLFYDMRLWIGSRS